MKKVAIVFLSLFIFGAASFCIIKYESLGSDTNYFNRNWRSKLSRSPLLRSWFELHFDGDAKADYLSKKYSRILIEVDYMNGLVVEPNALDQLVQKMKSITGKDVVYRISDAVPYSETSSAGDVVTLTRLYKNNSNAGGTAVLYLLYLNQDSESETILGNTNQEFGIVLYDKALKNFTAGQSATFDLYVMSTALHEFGHQLGLAHNEQSGCLMSSYVEGESTYLWSVANIVTDFCDTEKALIKK